jgi:carboxylesterase type B
MSKITLKTPCGTLTGLCQDSLSIFQGIPYCRTPRFQQPQEITQWDQTIDVTKDGANAAQYGAFCDESKDVGSFYYKEFRQETRFTYTEDYLTLNIVAPAKARNCPVLAFVHGGGFEIGTVGEMPYGKCAMYARHGIVFVSIGYRLNVFSLYRCLNLGLYDIACAFQWLSKNIASFGGDPEKMTAIGQSAGAMSLTDLSFSSLLKPYVKGMVLMSGGGAIPSLAHPLSKRDAAPFWDRIRAEAGAQSEEELLRVPSEALWKAWFKVRSQTADSKLIQPGIDGKIIRDYPVRMLKKGEQLDVPYLLGLTSQDMMGPVMLHMAEQWGEKAHCQGKTPVYAYLFSRTLPGGSYKAFHASDLWYLFGSMGLSWRPFDEKDIALSEEMAAHIAAFVKSGDPNVKGTSPWVPLGRRHALYVFDGNSHGMVSRFRCYRKEIYSALFDRGPI